MLSLSPVRQQWSLCGEGQSVIKEVWKSIPTGQRKAPIPNDTSEQNSCWNSIVPKRLELHREPQHLWNVMHQATLQISDQCQLLELKPLVACATRS